MKLKNIVTIPPDGGWGWVIVAVCFYAYALIDVPSIGFQVILQDLMDTLEIAASTASIIFSTYTLMLYFMGPFAGGICNRFGFKSTTICGCLLMMLGLSVSFFATSFITLIIFFGIIAGFGSSLVFMVANVAPGFWFEEKRAIALGLASSATGFAVFSVSLTTYFKESFGWKWCFIFWTACCAVLCMLAFLLRMPPMLELETLKSIEVDHVDIKQDATVHDVIRARTTRLRSIRLMAKNTQELVKKKLQKVAKTYGVPLRGPQAPPSWSPKEEEEQVGSGCAKWFRCCLRQGPQEIGSRPLYRKDIFYHGNVSYAAEVEEMPHLTYGFSVTLLPSVKDVQQEVEWTWKVPEAIVRALNEMVDLSLFKSAVFLFLVLASLLTYTAIYIPFLLIKRVNLDTMDEYYASMLTTIMGLGSIVGRSLIGFLLYFFPKIRALQVLIVFSMLGGLVICSFPIDYSFPYQAVVSFLSGALPGVITPLRSVVIIEMLGLEKLTNASGILFFVQGIGCFIGMPIAELLNELSDTEYLGLMFCGVCYVLTGFSFIGIAIVSIMKNKTNANS